MIKRGIGVMCLIALTSVTVTADSHLPFKGRSVKDVYPLHQTLQYEYTGSPDIIPNPNALLGTVVKSLDIENNERYMKTGEVYRDGEAYSIPLWEFQDFDISKSRTNTYCNIFTIDVLNIMANTLNDETYRIAKTPVLANSLRKRFKGSQHWKELDRREAIIAAQGGNVVVMSYVKNPHGHVAFVRPDSTQESPYLWNVGSTNSEKYKWTRKNATKYFMKL